MTLTKQDLEAIRDVVVDTTAPLFEQVFQSLERVERKQDEQSQTLSEHSRILSEHSRILSDHSAQHYSHSQHLTRIESRLDSIEGRLEALEADVKALYFMVDKIEKSQKPKGYDKLSLEKKLLTTHSMVMEIAKKYDIKLPPHK